MAGERCARGAVTVDPRWDAQEKALGLDRASGATGGVSEWAAADEVIDVAVLGAAVDLLDALTGVGRLQVLIPPPGAPPETPRRNGRAGADVDPVLAKVRALLAQAESTTYEAEAATFTAKAHELITRHAIDQAMLAGAGTIEAETPEAVRLPIDEPYVDAKSYLLQLVAVETRCQAIFHGAYALSTVVGFADDLRAVEMMFTSLLVQGQSALNQAASSAPPGARIRSQSFRSSFWLAYALRVGERLAAMNDHVYATATAESGDSFLPVLASRAERVHATCDDWFSATTVRSVRGGYDHLGHAMGREAADRAPLTAGDLDRASASAMPGSGLTTRWEP